MASTAETRQVEAHLSTCESCRQAYFWMRATNAVIANRPVAMPPVDMAARIQRAIAESANPVPIRLSRPAYRFNRGVYAAAASIAIAAFIVIPMMRASHNGGNVTVALHPVNVDTSTPPPPVAPVALNADRHTPITHHAPVKPVAHAPSMLALNREHEHPIPPSVIQRRPENPQAVNRSPVVHPDHAMVARVENTPSTSTHQTLPVHPPVPVHRVTEPEHVARNAPSTPDHVGTTQPTHVEAPAPSTPPVRNEPDRVAVAVPAPETPPAPVHQPETIVASAVVHHSLGLNDELHAAVATIRRDRVDSTCRSRRISGVRVADEPAVSIVSSTL